MRVLEEIILLGACSNGLGTFESQDGSAPAPPQMPNFGGGPPGAPAVMGGFGGGMPNFGGGPPGAPPVIGRQMPNLGGGPPGAPGVMGMSGFGGGVPKFGGGPPGAPGVIGMPNFGGGPPGSPAVLPSFGDRQMPNLGGGPPGAPGVIGGGRRMPNLGGGPPGAPGVMGMPQFGGGPPGAPAVMGGFGGGMPTFGGGPPGADAVPGMPVLGANATPEPRGHEHSHVMGDTIVSEGLPTQFPKPGLPPVEPGIPAPGSPVGQPPPPPARPEIPGLQAFGVAPPLPPGITMPPRGQSMRGFQMPSRKNTMPMTKPPTPPVPPPAPVENLPEPIIGTPDGWTPESGVKSPPTPVNDVISTPDTSLFNVNLPIKKPDLPEIPVHKESLAIAAALKPKIPGDIKPETTQELSIDETKSNQNESILSQLKTKYSGTPPPPTPPAPTTEEPTTFTMSNFEPYEDYQYENSNEVVGKLEEVVQIKQAGKKIISTKVAGFQLDMSRWDRSLMSKDLQ